MEALTQKERRRSQLIVAAFVAMNAYLIFFVSTGTGLWICPIRAITGYYCFGCGMTRSLGAFIRLDFNESFRMHAVGWIFYLGFFTMAITHAIELYLNRRLKVWIALTIRKYESWFWIVFSVLLFIFGIWRLFDHPHGLP